MATLKLTPAQKKKIFHLPVQQAIYVPSTTDKNKKISDAEFKRRVAEVKKYMSNKFGGYTTVRGTGGYYEKKKGLIQEKVAVVHSYAQDDAFKKNKPALIKKLGSWSKKWGQDAMGYEHEGDMYYLGAGLASPIKKKKISPSHRKKLLKNLIKARKAKGRSK